MERDRELAALGALLDRGGALVIEGGAGIGKTALATEAAAAARQRGWRVLRSCGSELESGFAFGVVRQLLERTLAEAGPEQRAGLLAGPAGPVAGLLAGPPGQAGEFGKAGSPGRRGSPGGPGSSRRRTRRSRSGMACTG